MTFHEPRDESLPLLGEYREHAQFWFRTEHYAHSIPSGKTHYFCCAGVFFAFAIPPNKNISRFLIGEDNAVWELSRMWASDNHGRNALTSGLSKAIGAFRKLEPHVKALVSYADPNVGHEGYVYRAASWVYCGQSEEGRYYRDATGQVVSRRAFHSGPTGLKKAEIESRGFVELKLPGKHRYAKGLTRGARAIITKRFVA